MIPIAQWVKVKTIFISSQQRWRGYSIAAVRVLLHGLVGGWVSACVRRAACKHDTD